MVSVLSVASGGNKQLQPHLPPLLLLFIRRFTVPDDESEAPLTRTILTGSQPSHFKVLELKSGTFFIQNILPESFYMTAVLSRN